MRFTIGSGNNRHSFERPQGKEERRSLALQIKQQFFPGKSWRIHKARGDRALALATA